MPLRAPKGKTGTRNTRNSGGLPEPSSGGDFDPFLKAADVGKLGTRAKIEIMGAPVEQESEFSDAIMPVRFKKNDYAFGIKWDGGNYARLYKRFGASEKKWKGTVTIEIKRFKKRDYVAVV